MITSKQRAYLRGLANTIPALYQLGKSGLTEEFAQQLDMALEANELIKINVLKNAFCAPMDIMDEICGVLECEPVSVIGNKLVIYRQSSDKDKRKIVLQD